MIGSVFENLPELQKVDLEFNKCIHKKFQSEEEIRGISKIVNRACGFDKNNTQIACESFPRSFGQDTCEMKTYTIIRDITYTILSDTFNKYIGGIDFSENRNIEFLPILLNLTFPNIKLYHAEKCAIKEISKRNFEGLVQLWGVYLKENQIYAILSATFEGLINLKEIDLRKFYFCPKLLFQIFLIFFKSCRHEQNQVYEQ